LIDTPSSTGVLIGMVWSVLDGQDNYNGLRAFEKKPVIALHCSVLTVMSHLAFKH
jgi:hypothetical protein